MISPIVKRSLGQTIMAAIVMGTLAMLLEWRVLYPSPHTSFTGSPALIGFEVAKAIVLFLILSRVYVLNGKEDDQAVRAKYVYVFGLAASLSLIIDVSISMSRQYL